MQVPPTNVFPEQPPANSVYMSDMPPPYPGISGFTGYSGGGFANPGGAAAAPVQAGFVDPNNPNTAYIPPPQNEQPPSYDDSVKKNN